MVLLTIFIESRGMQKMFSSQQLRAHTMDFMQFEEIELPVK